MCIAFCLFNIIVLHVLASVNLAFNLSKEYYIIGNFVRIILLCTEYL